LVGFYAEQWIPDPPALSRKTVAQVMKRVLGPDEYFSVYSRNLFNSKGLIPGEGEAELEGAVAQPTTLPVTLLGTLVLKDEKRSVASVEDKTSGSQVYALQMHDTLAGKLVVQKVEAAKLTFINLQNRKLEFVDIPEDVLNAGKAPRVTGSKSGGAGIDQVSPTQFSISRAEVDKNLADLNTILKQARAEQVFEKGSPAGFKFSDIVPGSIYDKLGLRNGDVIAAINGEPLSDPSKAIELLTQLKTASHLELQIKKDGGKVTNYSYDVR
jgi:general secretion pathway protein C